MTENRILNLLIVDRIDAVSQPLRDGGFIVQVERLEQEAEVQAYLQSKAVNLVIARPHPDLPAIAHIGDALRQRKTPGALLAIFDSDTTVAAGELFAAGVDGLCDPQQPEHLQRVVSKELDYQQLSQDGKEHERKLREAEERSRSILDHASEAIAYIHEGVHMYANPAYVALFGYANAEDLEGLPLMNMVAVDDRNQVKRFLRDSTKQGQALEPVQLNGLRTDGTELPIVMRCQPTRIDDEPCLQLFIDDPSRAADAAAAASNHDPQTRLYNRAFFIDYMGQRFDDESKRKQGAVLYILLEAYRPLNNRFGLDAGDILVQDIAGKLNQLIGSKDILARFGDGIFTLFSAKLNRDTATKLAEKICAEIKANDSYLDDSLLTTHASVGIALLETGYPDVSALMSKADSACGDARQKGGNQAVIAGDSTVGDADKAHAEDKAAVELIHAAISAERLRLLYQPVVSFADDSEERFQVRLDILDEAGKPLDMDHLGPIAERTNLMLPLDKWTIISALTKLTDRYQASKTLASLFIRLSGNALHQPDFLDWLQQRLRDTGLPGNVLIVEVLESVAEKHFKEAKPFRERLKKLGCGFALASFGDKANSERILQHLQPDYIKIDSEVIDRLSKNKNAKLREEFAELTQQAQQMNAQVVAANIANANQMASIWQFGVSLVQGDMVREADAEMTFDFTEFAAG